MKAKQTPVQNRWMLCCKGNQVSGDNQARPCSPCCVCHLGSNRFLLWFLCSVLLWPKLPHATPSRVSCPLGLDARTVSAYGSLRALPVSRTSRPLPYLKRNCRHGQWNTECEVKAEALVWGAVGV